MESDDDDANKLKVGNEKIYNDIFGDSDDDSDQGPTISKSNEIFGDDDGWNDSDDDTRRKPSENSRLQKSGKVKSKSTSKKGSKKLTVADIFGSDDDEDADPKQRLTKRTKKRKRREDKDDQKKTNPTSKGKSEDSSDEYDSGEEVTRTKDDDAFIDEEDEQGYLVKEYDEDVQDFRDEKPEDFRKSSKKSSKKSSTTTSEKTDYQANDPLSQTINAMKKPKHAMLSQSEKESFVKELLNKMSLASSKDDECMMKGQPAMHKLQILEGVQRAVALNQLHEAFLENDILSRLKEWIEPKSDADRTLPSLTVRTAVYEMLNILPCYAEHLKRSGIGITIMALRKHRNETIPNKNLLRSLIEKWSRPLFGKSTDQRSRDVEYNEDLKIAAARQKLSSSSKEEYVSVGSILSGETTAKESDAKARVRTPYNNGYVFTVRPENSTVERRDLVKERMGESKMNILKLTRIRKGGVKDNFRAVKMDSSGRDKA